LSKYFTDLGVFFETFFFEKTVIFLSKYENYKKHLKKIKLLLANSKKQHQNMQKTSHMFGWNGAFMYTLKRKPRNAYI